MIALAIAGLDPSGGAGIAADLRTFDRLGVHGAAVATVLTVQASRGVGAVEPVSATVVGAQLDELLADLPVRAAKTGALGTAAIVEAVARSLARAPGVDLVVDPVMLPTEGRSLCDAEGVRALVTHLLPRAALVTPNARELALLSGRRVESAADVPDACRALADRGARAVLAKGGHLPGDPGEECVDVLFDGASFDEVRGPRLYPEPGRIHGAGCTLSAAITAHLALGRSLLEAVQQARRHLAEVLAGARRLGRGDFLYGR